MKYETPKYEINAVETEDILIASSSFEISRTDTGEGKVQLDFSSLFR